ncbi:MAG TPA: hypothetical protein PLT03_03685 [Bacillota bacterium]|nr:hypothetical protein [Bacillota bacterium]HOG52956.1 hypothetical protein [Bacillota bacterium]
MPVIGDLFKGSATLVTGTPVEIKPASGLVARIHYLIHSDWITVKYLDVPNDREVEMGSYPANFLFGQALPVDSTFYLTVYGNTGVNIAWIGVYTKV